MCGAWLARSWRPGALTVANEGGTTKHMAVVAEHPELNVTLASEYPQTMEELTTAMVSGTRQHGCAVPDHVLQPRGASD